MISINTNTNPAIKPPRPAVKIEGEWRPLTEGERQAVEDVTSFERSGREVWKFRGRRRVWPDSRALGL